MTQEFTEFSSFGLSDALLKALADLQFIVPSPIQQQTIPRLLEGSDLIGLAQTGTGKTAAFALPILQTMDERCTRTQALIVAPTRELAIQVAAHFESLSVYYNGLRVAVLCGGQDYRPQLKQLREGAQIVVGTPGRILDHLERGMLQLEQLKTFVLDEADEMLRMGFVEDVETILAKLPEKRQMALFSATMPKRIRQIATNYLNAPVTVEIRTETATVKSIEQRFLFASQAQKPDALLRVLACECHQGVMVFVRTKQSADELSEFLQHHKIRAMSIHGDLTQALRERIISQFKQGGIDVLVATDVAARGLDVERVTHVINYDMAHDCETYVHRIGRTGRAGRSGVTILFVTPKESRMLHVLERHIRQRIIKMPIPTDAMIQAAKEQQFLDNILARKEHKHVSDYKHLLEQFIEQNDTCALDIAASLALMLHQDKPWRTQFIRSLDMPHKENNGHKKNASSKRINREEMKTVKVKKRMGEQNLQEVFRLDVGKEHGAKAGHIIGAIANEGGLQGRYITGLKIHDRYSTVRLPKDMPRNVVNLLNKARVCGRPLKLTLLAAE